MSVTDLLAEPRRALKLAELRGRREDILVSAAQHGVSNVRVFGSVARDEATDDSDLDLLVDVEDGRSLMDLASFAIEVQDLMEVFTQVVTVPGLANASVTESWQRPSPCEKRRRPSHRHSRRLHPRRTDPRTR